jgi:hypothetical protein
MMQANGVHMKSAAMHIGITAPDPIVMFMAYTQSSKPVDTLLSGLCCAEAIENWADTTTW